MIKESGRWRVFNYAWNGGNYIVIEQGTLLFATVHPWTYDGGPRNALAGLAGKSLRDLPLAGLKPGAFEHEGGVLIMLQRYSSAV